MSANKKTVKFFSTVFVKNAFVTLDNSLSLCYTITSPVQQKAVRRQDCHGDVNLDADRTGVDDRRSRLRVALREGLRASSAQGTERRPEREVVHHRDERDPGVHHVPNNRSVPSCVLLDKVLGASGDNSKNTIPHRRVL